MSNKSTKKLRYLDDVKFTHPLPLPGGELVRGLGKSSPPGRGLVFIHIFLGERKKPENWAKSEMENFMATPERGRTIFPTFPINRAT